MKQKLEWFVPSRPKTALSAILRGSFITTGSIFLANKISTHWFDPVEYLHNRFSISATIAWISAIICILLGGLAVFSIYVGLDISKKFLVDKSYKQTQAKIQNQLNSPPICAITANDIQLLNQKINALQRQVDEYERTLRNKIAENRSLLLELRFHLKNK